MTGIVSDDAVDCIEIRLDLRHLCDERILIGFVGCFKGGEFFRVRVLHFLYARFDVIAYRWLDGSGQKRCLGDSHG